MEIKYDFSIIVPVYNSEHTLIELSDRLVSVMNNIGKTFEIIFIDDYSKDNSWEVIKSIKEKYPNNVVAIKLSKNFGQHNASLCGIEHSSGALVITIDDDLQTPPEEISKLIERQEMQKSDLVYGIFKNKKHSWIRNLGSYVIKKSAKLLSKYPGQGSSFRIFTHELAANVKNHKQHFLFLDELFMWYTSNIDFVEVTHQKRKEGTSGYSNFKLFRITLNILFYYTTFPLKLITLTGFFMSIVTLLIGIRFIIFKIFYNVPLGYTSIIVAILFTASIIMLCLGIIGEYLSRIYLVQNNKPPYVLKYKI